MIELEDLHEQEFPDFVGYGGITIVMTAKYRGHRLAVRSKIEYEVHSQPHLKEAARSVMIEELEFQASRLDPVHGNPMYDSPPGFPDFDYEAFYYDEIDLINDEVLWTKEAINWKQEGF